MRHNVKRAFCLLVSLSILLTLTAVFTLSTTAAIPSKGPMIAVGNNFMIVQTESGEIWGWGDNSNKVLGTASSDTTGSNITSPTKITLPNGITSVSISAGYDHVLMLGSDGNVYAWGNNTAGQLGTDVSDSLAVPTLVEGLCGKNIKAVAAGKRFSLALTDGGSVYSFGLNDELQLGYEPTTEFSHTPALIEELSGVFVAQINAGYESATVVDINGKVYLWGSKKGSLLGESGSNPVTPFVLPDSKTTTPIVSSVLSATHSAFLLNDGTMGFMGINNYGQYGNSEKGTQAATRFKPTDTSSLGVSAIAVSDQQTVLLTVDGKVFTAGARIPNDESSATNTFVPLFGEQQKVPVATAIAAGYRNGAMIAQDGSIWTWGDNSCGQLGNGVIGEGQATPVKVFASNDSDFDMGQAPSVMDVPMKFTTTVPSPTYAIVIPSTVNVGELRQTNESDPDRNALTKFTVKAQNVGNLFGEKEIQVSVRSNDAGGVFYLQDGNGATLPFELFADESLQTSINSGDIFARFSENGSVDTWICIDQSKISKSGIYNGVLVFSYTVEEIN